MKTRDFVLLLILGSILALVGILIGGAQLTWSGYDCGSVVRPAYPAVHEDTVIGSLLAPIDQSRLDDACTRQRVIAGAAAIGLTLGGAFLLWQPFRKRQP